MGMFDFLGGSSQKQETKPWEKQAPYLEQGFEKAGGWLDNVTANPNQDVAAGRDMQRQSVMTGLGGTMENSNRVGNMFSSGELLEPNSNPWLQQNLDVLGSNVTQQADRNQNQISQQAAQAGAYGGGRQGVAEGLNAEAATDAFTDASSRILMDNYNQRLQQMQSQQRFFPQQAQLDQMPGMLLENLGMAERNQPMEDLQRYWSIIGSGNWGGQSSGSNQASPLQMLSQLGSGVGGIMGAMG